MRMRLQAMKSCSDTPLHVTKHLDLSDKEIVAIEGLQHCPLLESLVLRCNYIDILCNLDYCRNLWHLDLSANRVKSLVGMGQFPSMGYISLSFNDLSWRELNRLHHMHILRLTLLGNPQLDSDPNYRQHVVSILPHVWMLDGLLITAGERSKVTKFFYHSRNSSRPVWCKTPHDNFTPSAMKNLFVKGKFGPKTAHMMQHIPIHCSHTTEIDQRRLIYLGSCIEEQMQLETKTRFPLIQSILASRQVDEGVDQCNMLLLLLLAALKYKLPPVAMAAAFNTAKIYQLCSGSDHIELLPSYVQLHLASLLLSAVIIDHDTHCNGILSSALFNSAMASFQTVQRELQALHTNKLSWKYGIETSPDDTSNESVLAAEVVQMFCLVPTFIDILLNKSDPGVAKLVTTATKNNKIMDTIISIATSSPSDMRQQNVASHLMDIVQHNVSPRKPITKMKQRRHSTPAMRGHGGRSHYTTRVKSAGDMINCKSTFEVKCVAAGDIVLLSDQGTVAKVISEQENHLVLLQTMSEMKNRFLYVNVQNMTWNHGNRCWETDVGQLDSSVEMSTHSTQSVISDEGITGIDDTNNVDNSSAENEVAKGNRRISLLVDMSDKSLHDTVAMTTDMITTTNLMRSEPLPTSALWSCSNSIAPAEVLSTNYRVMQRQQTKNSDIQVVQPRPPPTSPVHHSHTPIIVQHAWGPLHTVPSTKHTLTSYKRLLHRKQQQQPLKPSPSGNGTSVLQQSQPLPSASGYYDRMPVHSTKLLLHQTCKWQSPLITNAPPTRKLGSVLSIHGSSLLH